MKANLTERLTTKRWEAAVQQKKTKATKQVRHLRCLCGLLFGLPSLTTAYLAVHPVKPAFQHQDREGREEEAKRRTETRRPLIRLLDFSVPDFFASREFTDLAATAKVGKKIEGKKMGGAVQQKETKATKQPHPLRSLRALLFELPSPDDRRLVVLHASGAAGERGSWKGAVASCTLEEVSGGLLWTACWN